MVLTPSATAGPYLAIGLTWDNGHGVVPVGTPGGFWIRGIVFDGLDEPVADALVETWQADPNGRFDHPDDPRGAQEYPDLTGFGRSQTVNGGEFSFYTLKPGRVPDGEGGLQAPHIDVSVFARGLLNRLVTRIYFEDEAEANAEDVVLNSVPEERRRTLLARRTEDGYRFDLNLQGDPETVFFSL
ncbi:protocatechuate 3,4-dioxygenase subunit alpha [Geodermatophilus sp. TF02-6]|nr:protocatechuate 3,4-dioxygenase subunit alpha [Geodermatophilus sp. TF02-6]